MQMIMMMIIINAPPSARVTEYQALLIRRLNVSRAYTHGHRSIPDLLSHDFLPIKTMVHGKHLQHTSRYRKM